MYTWGRSAYTHTHAHVYKYITHYNHTDHHHHHHHHTRTHKFHIFSSVVGFQSILSMQEIEIGWERKRLRKREREMWTYFLYSFCYVTASGQQQIWFNMLEMCQVSYKIMGEKFHHTYVVKIMSEDLIFLLIFFIHSSLIFPSSNIFLWTS